MIQKKYLATEVTGQLMDPFSPSYLPLDVTPLHTIKSVLHCVYISCTSLCWLIDFLSALASTARHTHTHTRRALCMPVTAEQQIRCEMKALPYT